MNKATFTLSPDGKSLRVERTFATTTHKLWMAYADPSLLRQWFSPEGWETEVTKHDFTNGGEFSYVMKCVDESQEWFGQKSMGKMIFDKISPESSFEYRDYFIDESGEVNAVMPASHSVVSIVELNPTQSQLIVITTYDSAEALQQVLEMGMEEGYGQTLNKLDEILTT